MHFSNAIKTRKGLQRYHNLGCDNLAFAVKLFDRQRHMLVGIGSLRDIGIFGDEGI